MLCKVRVFVRVRREAKAKHLRVLVVIRPLLGNTGIISLIPELRRAMETYLLYSP